MNNQWEHICPKCRTITTNINNYFCIKNTGLCEYCLSHNTKREIKKYKKEIDPFAKWRPKNLLVDKSKKSGFGNAIIKISS